MIDRREFLRCAGVAGGALLMPELHGWAAPPAAGSLHRVSVTDFGADPSGLKDSTQAVQQAITALARRNARLVFPAGKYVFAASDAVVMDFRGFEGLEIFGNGGELFFDGASQPLRMAQCRELEVHDILIDWVRPPVSQGVVRASTDRSITIAVDPAFPVTGTEHIATLIGIDDVGGAPALSGPLVESGIGAVQLRGAQVLEIALEHAQKFPDGMRIALLHKGGSAPAIGVTGCEQVLLESVQLHAAPAGAISLQGCRDITLDTVAVQAHPGSGRLVSANRCGVDMLDCTGSLTVEHTRLGGTVGPAMRIQQSYWRLAQILDPQSVLAATADGNPLPEWALPRPGAYLQLSQAGTLKLLGEIILTRAEPAPGGMKLQFEETLSPAIGAGALLCLSATDQPRLKMEDTQFLGGASIGLVAQSRIHIRSTRFANYAGPAVVLAPDLAGMRGPVVESVHIDDCRFERCELGGDPAAMRGTVTIDTAPGPAQHAGGAGEAARVNQGITLQGNTFDRSGGPAVYCAGTSWLDVESNHFNNCDQRRPQGATPRAIVLHNLTDSTITLNDARANANIVMVDCTDKVKAVENGTLEIARG